MAGMTGDISCCAFQQLHRADLVGMRGNVLCCELSRYKAGLISVKAGKEKWQVLPSHVGGLAWETVRSLTGSLVVEVLQCH